MLFFAYFQTQSSWMASWHCPILRLHWTMGGHCVALGSLFGFQASNWESPPKPLMFSHQGQCWLNYLRFESRWVCLKMGKNCHEMMGHILKYDDSPWDSGEFLIYRGMDPWEHCCWATEQTSMRRTEVARCPFPYSFILRWRVNPLRTNRQMILDDLPDWQLDFLSKRTLGSEWIVISIYMLNILFISQFDSWKGCWAEN